MFVHDELYAHTTANHNRRLVPICSTVFPFCGAVAMGNSNSGNAIAIMPLSRGVRIVGNKSSVNGATHCTNSFEDTWAQLIDLLNYPIKEYRMRQSPVNITDMIRLHSRLSLKVDDGKFVRLEWVDTGIMLQPGKKVPSTTDPKFEKMFEKFEKSIPLENMLFVPVEDDKRFLDPQHAAAALRAVGVVVPVAGGCVTAAAAVSAALHIPLAAMAASGAGVLGVVAVGAVGGAVAAGTSVSDRTAPWKKVHDPSTAWKRVLTRIRAMSKNSAENQYNLADWNCAHFANAIRDVLDGRS